MFHPLKTIFHHGVVVSWTKKVAIWSKYSVLTVIYTVLIISAVHSHVLVMSTKTLNIEVKELQLGAYNRLYF
jgi:hypothetical protein